MEKEKINNVGPQLIDYLRSKPHRGALEATLMRKFPIPEVIEILNFLEEAEFAVVKKIRVVPTRTY
jgi:hypothetical protein